MFPLDVHLIITFVPSLELGAGFPSTFDANFGRVLNRLLKKVEIFLRCPGMRS